MEKHSPCKINHDLKELLNTSARESCKKTKHGKKYSPNHERKEDKPYTSSFQVIKLSFNGLILKGLYETWTFHINPYTPNKTKQEKL